MRGWARLKRTRERVRLNGRPWSWVCNDAETAGAIGEMLRRIEELALEGVGLAAEEENGIADDEWRQLDGKLHDTVCLGG